MPQQSRIFHPELLLKKKKSSKSLANPCLGKIGYGNTQEGRKKKKSEVAGTLLFIVQYFTESTKASSVLTRIVL